MIGTTLEPAMSENGARALRRAQDIGELVAREAVATEEAATITQPVLDALIEAKLNWVVVPKDLGGLGLSMAEGVRIAEEIARADGSTGWSYMATAFGTAIVSGFISSEGAAELFHKDRPAITAGMLLPRGTAARVDGGYLIDGNYSFASGSAFADWIGVGFLVADEDGQLIVDDNGTPEARIGLLPRDEVDFKGGWNVWGLVGTGSYDYSVDRKFVPEHLTLPTFATEPVHPDPIFRIGTVGLGVLGHAAVVLGLAHRALEEVATITAKKVRIGQTTPVGDSELFRHGFASAEASLQAARLYVYHVIDQAEITAARGESLTAEQTARLRQAVTWVHARAKEIVDFAHLWSGSSGIRDNTAIGRCVRDMAVATQHVLVDQGSLADATVDIIAGYRSQA